MEGWDFMGHWVLQRWVTTVYITFRVPMVGSGKVKCFLLCRENLARL